MTNIVAEAKDFRVERLMPGFTVTNKRLKTARNFGSWRESIAYVLVERENFKYFRNYAPRQSRA